MKQISNLTIEALVVKFSAAIDGTIKGGRRNFLMRIILFFLLFTLMAMGAVNNVKAASFDCKKKLDESTVRFSCDPSNLILGQSCEVSVLDAKGKKVSDKNFTLSSRNKNVSSNKFSFFVDPNAKGEPWLHADGKLIEIDGDISIEYKDKKCNLTHDFFSNQTRLFI